jgi:hypothetical protein
VARSLDLLNQHARLPQQGPQLRAFLNGIGEKANASLAAAAGFKQATRKSLGRVEMPNL